MRVTKTIAWASLMIVTITATIAYAILATVAVCLLGYFLTVGPSTDRIRFQDEDAPRPAIWCPGDAVSYSNSRVVVSGRVLRYSGSITNTCKYPAIINVRVTVGVDRGSANVAEDFFVAGEGDVIRPGRSVGFSRSILLSKQEGRHDRAARYFIHKYAHSTAYAGV